MESDLTVNKLLNKYFEHSFFKDLKRGVPDYFL